MKKALTFHCQCSPLPGQVNTLYQDQFGRNFCCKACFVQYNPPHVRV